MTISESIIASAKEETDATIDWRKILIAYIRCVGNAEGVDFLGDDDEVYLRGLNSSEMRALALARDEAWKPLNVLGPEK